MVVKLLIEQGLILMLARCWQGELLLRLLYVDSIGFVGLLGLLGWGVLLLGRNCRSSCPSIPIYLYIPIILSYN